MSNKQLKVNDIVRWNGRLYDLKWVKPSSGVCKIYNPNTKDRPRLVMIDEVQFVARAINSRRVQEKLHRQYMRLLLTTAKKLKRGN